MDRARVELPYHTKEVDVLRREPHRGFQVQDGNHNTSLTTTKGNRGASVWSIGDGGGGEKRFFWKGPEGSQGVSFTTNKKKIGKR